MFLNDFSRKPTFHQAVFFLCAVLLMGCVARDQTVAKDQGKKASPIPQVAGNTTLSVEEMQEDLTYTVEILKDVHPKTYRGLRKEQQAMIQTAYEQIQAPMKASEFYFVVNSVICSMNDGHTHLRPMQNEQNRCIDVPLIWLHDGLYIKSDREPFKQGDKIVAMGGKGIDDLFKELKCVVPAENDHLRRIMACRNIVREEFLDFLGTIRNDDIEICVQRAGNILNIMTPLKPAAQCKVEDAKRSWVGYDIEEELSLGIFYLDACRINETYRNKVRAFFTEISERNIRSIAIDVRRNGGGTSQVIDEFMKYLDVDKYKWFGMDVRCSKIAKALGICRRDTGYRSSRGHNIRRNRKVQESHLLFNGDIYVLTSPRTFSTGNWFAVTMRDNNLGTIIGEPTGNQPTSYGDSPEFLMPRTGFKFTVSLKKWIRPNTKNDPEDSLYPDILVYTTIEDIKQNRDPQLKKLKKMIRSRER